jgi:hypothetical protein
MYAKLSQGATVAHFSDIWKAALPLKIKIFAWKMALDKLHFTLQIAVRHGPSNGACALCGTPVDAAHFFFTCSLAVFAWSVLRQCLGAIDDPRTLRNFTTSSLAWLGVRVDYFGCCFLHSPGICGKFAISLLSKRNSLTTLLM